MKHLLNRWGQASIYASDSRLFVHTVPECGHNNKPEGSMQRCSTYMDDQILMWVTPPRPVYPCFVHTSIYRGCEMSDLAAAVFYSPLRCPYEAGTVAASMITNMLVPHFEHSYSIRYLTHTIRSHWNLVRPVYYPPPCRACRSGPEAPLVNRSSGVSL